MPESGETVHQTHRRHHDVFNLTPQRTIAKIHSRTLLSERQSIWSIKKKWRPVYSGLFTFQTLSFILGRTRQEIFLIGHGTPAEAVEAIGRDIPLITAISVANTITLTEVMDTMLGTRDAINDWLEKRHQRARTEGHTEGRAEKQAEWLAWYRRMREAQEHNLPFDEAPPGT